MNHQVDPKLSLSINVNNTDCDILSGNKEFVFHPITILKRPATKIPTSGKPSEILYPKMPYHVRYALYLQKRNELLEITSERPKIVKKPKRSTLRLRSFYRLRRLCKKILVSTIVSGKNDMRYYAKVSFLDYNEYGLLDTGTSISCIGSELASRDFSKYPNFFKCKTFVNTADGNTQNVVGWLDVMLSFKDKSKPLKLFIIPSISQNLILGIDFWKTFDLIPNIVGSVDLLTSDTSTDILSKIHSIHDNCKIGYQLEQLDQNMFPLSDEQRKHLKTVIDLFPNYETQGLGRTSLIQHKIDVGITDPIKQRFYSVSPAVEKLMFGEIDRMIKLGVIEPSSSAWSSPMRLVIKPNKIRLCLDARKLNSVTKKDAYPLPNIEGIFQN